MLVRIAALVIATLLVVAPSHAHHSGAIFDSDSMVTLTGKVREFQWTNPHCFIQVTVAGAAVTRSGASRWARRCCIRPGGSLAR